MTEHLPAKKLVSRLADRFGVDPDKFVNTLKQTAFRTKDGAPTNEQMMALLVVAEQYELNPFTKEIYAFPDKQNGIVPIVGVDGWSRIINSHPQLDGIEFIESEEWIDPTKDEQFKDAKPCPTWIECRIYRKDRAHPVCIREYLDEVYRPPFEGISRDGRPYKKSGPWQTHTKRFLRHKTLIQGGRLAMGFVGLYDPDEGERIREARDMGEARIVEPEQPAQYPQEDFDAQFDTWSAVIWNGQRSADELIAMLETKGELTDDMKKRLRAVRVADKTETEGESA